MPVFYRAKNKIKEKLIAFCNSINSICFDNFLAQFSFPLALYFHLDSIRTQHDSFNTARGTSSGKNYIAVYNFINSMCYDTFFWAHIATVGVGSQYLFKLLQNTVWFHQHGWWYIQWLKLQTKWHNLII